MAEIWGAAIMVGGAVLSSQAAKKKAKQDKADNKEMTREVPSSKDCLTSSMPTKLTTTSKSLDKINNED